MKAIVKSLWLDSATISLEEYSPEDPRCFGLWIEFRAGPEGKAGADDFRLFVCTPIWLKNECNRKGETENRHVLVVEEYDPDVIKNKIDRRVENSKGENWPDIARKISRFAAWEFENYQS